MKKPLIIFATLCLALSYSGPALAGEVGINIRQSGLTTGQNIFYGNAKGSTLGNLLMLESNNGVGRFKIGLDGKVYASGGYCDINGSNCVTGGSQWTTSGNDIYNSNTGNVGIGTSPSEKLTVAGTTGLIGNIILSRPGSAVTRYIDMSHWSSGNNLIFRNSFDENPNCSNNPDNTFTTQIWGDLVVARDTKCSPPSQGNLTVAYNAYLATVGGNVGIGTASPGATLHVNGLSFLNNPSGNNYNENIRLARANNQCSSIAVGAVAGTSGTGAGQWTMYSCGSPYNFNINYGGGADAISITSAGNVGIGTASPGAKLHLSGSQSATSIKASYDAAIFPDYSYTITQTGAADETSGTRGLVINANLGQSVATYGIGFAIANSNKMFIRYDGNVGIGQNSPSYKLHVAGDIYADGGWLRTSGNTGWYSESYGGGWHMTDSAWIRSYNNKNIYHNTGIMRTDGTFQVGDSGGTLNVANGGNFAYRTNVLFANTADNVGIGTTVPNGKLDISTNGGSDGVVIYQPSDNASSIQSYIDGQWSNRSTYAGGCCNMLNINTTAGDVSIGANNGRSVSIGSAVSVISGNMYFPGSGIWNSSGNVGIGLTNPGHKLHVGVADSAYQAVTIRGYSNDPSSWKGGAAFGYTSASVIMGEHNGVAQIGGVNSTLSGWANLAINSGGGNVGIGMSSPVERLDVAGRTRLRLSGVSLGSGNSSQLEINNAGSGAANISFHREGQYGAHFGLDTDNSFSTYGWSAGGGYTPMRVGHLTAVGNINTSGNIYLQNYGLGLVGVYSASRYQGVFSMGDAYKLPADGTTPGTLYGIAWTHSNVGGQSILGLGHQALFMENGVTQTAIGNGVWTRANVNAVEVYARSWLRNINNLTGLYNEAVGAHFYASAANVWNMGGGNAYPQLILRDNHQSTVRGSLYSNDTGFGLLHSGGEWAIRTAPGSNTIYMPGNVGIGTADPGSNSLKIYGGSGGGKLWVGTVNGRILETCDGCSPGNVVYMDNAIIDEGLRVNSGGGTGITVFNNTTGLSVNNTGDARINVNDGTRGWSIASGWNVDGDFNIIEEGVSGWRFFIQKTTGNVSIGNGPSSDYRLYVAGNAYSTGGWAGSDARWKKNITPLKNSLDKIIKLEGVSYYWNTEDYPDKGFDDSKQIGIIAQEAEKIIPELVKTDEEGYKSFSYEKLSGVLVEAIKEQQKQIEELKAKVKELKKN